MKESRSLHAVHWGHCNKCWLQFVIQSLDEYLLNNPTLAMKIKCVEHVAVVRNKCRCPIILQNIQRERKLGGYLTCPTRHNTQCLLIDAVSKSRSLTADQLKNTNIYLLMNWFADSEHAQLLLCAHAIPRSVWKVCENLLNCAVKITIAEDSSTPPQCWHLPDQSISDIKGNILSCTRDLSFIQNK